MREGWKARSDRETMRRDVSSYRMILRKSEVTGK
jgi:hypothetical protein